MRILIADDSASSRRLLQETLKRWGYEVCAVQDGAEAWAVLSGENPPSLAIFDWMMPGFTGPQLCEMVRKNVREPYTYILLLTSRSDRDDVVEGMEAGADDYITKPFDKHELQVRLRAGRRIVELQKQLLDTREALRVQATRDYLTQIWNRSAILDLLDRELARSRREGTAIGVVLADLDAFKRINDTYGHMAGDAVLRQAAATMQAAVRPYDSIGRYGGEEFVILVPGADEETVRLQAERMRIAIRATPIVLPEGSLSITCSFGCTVAHGHDATAEILIREADTGLYRAKRAGRDRVEFVPLRLPTAAAIVAR